jgi:NTP pyrophosphatase (non-canonical NTP hydrolase)
MVNQETLKKKINKFREERDWKKFHNPKDLALSLVLEATEVLEHFQWKNGEQIDEHVKNKKSEIKEELADVYYWLLTLSHDLGIDLNVALEDKLIKNEEKYPVDKAKGSSKKYTEL